MLTLSAGNKHTLFAAAGRGTWNLELATITVVICNSGISLNSPYQFLNTFAIHRDTYEDKNVSENDIIFAIQSNGLLQIEDLRYRFRLPARFAPRRGERQLCYPATESGKLVGIDIFNQFIGLSFFTL